MFHIYVVRFATLTGANGGLKAHKNTRYPPQKQKGNTRSKANAFAHHR